MSLRKGNYCSSFVSLPMGYRVAVAALLDGLLAPESLQSLNELTNGSNHAATRTSTMLTEVHTSSLANKCLFQESRTRQAH